jgi:hypothetical protein
MPSHRLTVESSHGQEASLYWPVCSCGWIGGDCRTQAEAREEFTKHMAGDLPPWTIMEGQEPGWDRR